jgi:2-oxo-4-hydroxy-4-carboxy-5-ureidoimidazoline decarboxylase
LYGCLANRRWAQAVASGQPYRDAAGLFDSAANLMETLTDEEWLEAMKAHPRIGERGGDAPASSEREQSRAMQGSPETLAALAAENRQYEDRFGHVFLIAASGRTAEDILAELRRRMNNDPAAELQEAKRELRMIAQLRLATIVS